MDVPLEVFEVTLCHIIQSNNFGHRFEETPAYTKVSITDTRKAVFIFNKMNVDCVIVSRAKLLKRSLGIFDELERCEVVISEEKPLVLKYLLKFFNFMPSSIFHGAALKISQQAGQTQRFPCFSNPAM